MIETAFIAVIALVAVGNVAAQVVMKSIYPHGLPRSARLAD
ncbi:hypothetical protein [Roseomonas elaeocarpi]|uniref:Uncharacterized protein n=1 Tax=Roseomonas elaeocarpi TaxID=907779 RepID=A0ABV6JT91_9PROT